MARHALLLLAIVAALAAAASTSAVVHGRDVDMALIRHAESYDEFEVGSGGGDLRRRLDGLDGIDMTSGFISYLVLLADTTLCSQRGASYYNCQPGGEARPYERGCSAITKCRD